MNVQVGQNALLLTEQVDEFHEFVQSSRVLRLSMNKYFTWIFKV